ncbi:S-phase kinase-associated protein 1 [Lemmus lemmus]
MSTHVPLLKVNAAAVLKRIIQQCTHQGVDPPHPREEKNKEKRTDAVPFWNHEA